MTHNLITKDLKKAVVCLGIASVLLMGIAIRRQEFCLDKQGKNEVELFENLANHRLYFPTLDVGIQSQHYFTIQGTYEDRNGIYEPVLGFLNLMTGELESQILEKKERESVFKKFDVIDGKIVYLRE